MSVKIQINSLAALERLIGGDSELEIELRQTAITEYSKKYLRTMLNDSIVFGEIHSRLFVKDDTKSNYYSTKYKFNPEIEAIFKKVLEEHFARITTESIRTYIDALVNQEISDRLNGIKRV